MPSASQPRAPGRWRRAAVSRPRCGGRHRERTRHGRLPHASLARRRWSANGPAIRIERRNASRTPRCRPGRSPTTALRPSAVGGERSSASAIRPARQAIHPRRRRVEPRDNVRVRERDILTRARDSLPPRSGSGDPIRPRCPGARGQALVTKAATRYPDPLSASRSRCRLRRHQLFVPRDDHRRRACRIGDRRAESGDLLAHRAQEAVGRIGPITARQCPYHESVLFLHRVQQRDERLERARATRAGAVCGPWVPCRRRCAGSVRRASAPRDAAARTLVGPWERRVHQPAMSSRSR